ncbi:hypothetical protein ACVBEF_16435 [Glaciimonas sp. GG7]
MPSTMTFICARLQSLLLRRWLFFLIVLPAILLTALPAQAIVYTFPGTLPSGCSGGSGSYTCTALTLAAGDSLVISVPTTITVAGGFATGANCQINSGGNAADLIINTGGAISIGASTTSNATLTAAGAIDFGQYSTINGDMTTTGIGAVTIGANSIANSNITTVTGAITLGASSTVTGSFTVSQVGAITLGASTNVTGNLSAATGAITVGASSNITGSLYVSGVGAVTVGASTRIIGSITTSSGAITIGASSRVDSLTSTKGDGIITLGAGDIIFSVCCLSPTDSGCVLNNTGTVMPTVCPMPARPVLGAAPGPHTDDLRQRNGAFGHGQADDRRRG